MDVKLQWLLEAFGIESEIRVASAHKAAVYCLELLNHYESMDGQGLCDHRWRSMR